MVDPASSGVKSPLPCLSAFAHKGVRAVAANGRTSAVAPLDPSPLKLRLTVPRAGRLVNALFRMQHDRFSSLWLLPRRWRVWAATTCHPASPAVYQHALTTQVGLRLLAAVLLTTLGAQSAQAALEALEAPARSGCHTQAEALISFKRVIANGELVLFGHRVKRGELVPSRIEFGYDIRSQTSTVTVKATLKKALPLPHGDEMVVRSVDVVLDAKGRFVESRAHVHPR